jgi:hypothetical protein
MENPGRVAERRNFARKKRRFLVEFKVKGTQCTGFTYDISPMSMFVRSVRLPDLGAILTANVHLPQDKRVEVIGKVIRSIRVPGSLSRLLPSGFSIQLSEAPEDYAQFVAAL